MSKNRYRGEFLLHLAIKRKFGFLFKYENLSNFYFSCGRVGHAVKDCIEIPNLGEEKLEEDFPYSLALKVESNLVGKEILQFGFSVKNFMK